MDPDDWERLGDYLTSRRIELALGVSREDFFAARDPKLQRIAVDLENAKRRNFDRATFARVEAAYAWTPGSVRTVLAGGEPTPIERTELAGKSDEVEVAEAIERDPVLTEEARQHLLSQYDMLRRLSAIDGSNTQRSLRSVARKRPPRDGSQ